MQFKFDVLRWLADHRCRRDCHRYERRRGLRRPLRLASPLVHEVRVQSVGHRHLRNRRAGRRALGKNLSL